jgi:hypothetical protein
VVKGGVQYTLERAAPGGLGPCAGSASLAEFGGGEERGAIRARARRNRRLRALCRQRSAELSSGKMERVREGEGGRRTRDNIAVLQEIEVSTCYRASWRRGSAMVRNCPRSPMSSCNVLYSNIHSSFVFIGPITYVKTRFAPRSRPSARSPSSRLAAPAIGRLIETSRRYCIEGGRARPLFFSPRGRPSHWKAPLFCVREDPRRGTRGGLRGSFERAAAARAACRKQRGAPRAAPRARLSPARQPRRPAPGTLHGRAAYRRKIAPPDSGGLAPAPPRASLYLAWASRVAQSYTLGPDKGSAHAPRPPTLPAPRPPLRARTRRARRPTPRARRRRRRPARQRQSCRRRAACPSRARSRARSRRP